MIRVTIGFSRPKHPFPILSWIIRLVERTPYSHVYLHWQSSTGPHVVYEASGTRVRFMNKKIFDEIATTVDSKSFYISKEEYRKLIKFVMSNVGTEYGFLQLAGIGLVKVFGLKKNPFSDGRASQVCSETVAYFIESVLGYTVDFDKDIAGPKEIHNFISNLGEK